MKIGFLGSGKMAGALVHGVVQSGAVPREAIAVCDVAGPVAEKLAGATGVRWVASNAELAAFADCVVLCVKPGDALAALEAVAAGLAGKLVLSIAAGLPTHRLQAAAGAQARIIRVMPNTPALVQKGAAVYCLGETATEADAQAAEQIFRSVGSVSRVKESLLDAVTGLSGSGPGYVYLVIEALSDAGVLMGLPRELSLNLAAQTVAGTAEMVMQTGRHPAVLREEVTSPGGTTIAGIEALEAGGLRAALLAAVRAATARARELGA